MSRALYDSESVFVDDRGIGELLSEKKKFETWLKVEAILAKAQAKFGFIPEDAATKIEESCKLEKIDLQKVAKIKEKIGHGFVPFLKVLNEVCDPEASKYIHYGVATQNIQQTTQLYIAKQIHYVFLDFLADILNNLAKIAIDCKDAVMPGRTHSRHAVPMTYGHKVATWINEISNCIDALVEAEPRAFQVMMGGAVGAFNSSVEVGREVQDEVAKQLGMNSMIVPSRNISSHKEEYIMKLALVCNSLHKIAEEVYYTGMEEIGEVFEPFKEGTVGSSTMPQKINPKLAKGIIANSQKLYTIVPAGLYSNVRLYEGDSSSYMLFDGLIEEALQLATEVIKRAEKLTRGLIVDKERLYKHAWTNKGLDNSEFVMMNLAEKLGKNKAHELLYEKAMLVEREGREFIDVLKEDALISSEFTSEELERMIRPESYIGKSSELAQELASFANEKASSLKNKIK